LINIFFQVLLWYLCVFDTDRQGSKDNQIYYKSKLSIIIGETPKIFNFYSFKSSFSKKNIITLYIEKLKNPITEYEKKN